MTRHPAREVAHPFTDPTDWRDELDDLRRMLAEAGRTRPLRDELAQLLVEVGRGDRIVLALRLEQRESADLADGFGRERDFANATTNFLVAGTYSSAATIAEATQ